MRSPDRGQVVGKLWSAEPRLRIYARPIVMRRVHDSARNVELHGRRARVEEVSAPPVPIVARAFHALHKDQQIGIRRQDGVAGALSGRPPIGRRVSTSPRCRTAWLVVEVHAQQRGLAAVALGQHDPVGDPALLRYGVRVPQLRLASRCRSVAIQNDLEPAVAGAMDEHVHHFQAGLAGEVGVDVVVDVLRHTARDQRVIAERQPHGVEAQRGYLIEHRLPVPRPQSVGGIRASLHAKPADASDLHRLTLRRQHPRAAGVEAGALRRLRQMRWIVLARFQRIRCGNNRWQAGRDALHHVSGLAANVSRDRLWLRRRGSGRRARASENGDEQHGDCDGGDHGRHGCDGEPRAARQQRSPRRGPPLGSGTPPVRV